MFYRKFFLDNIMIPNFVFVENKNRGGVKEQTVSYKILQFVFKRQL